jgi:hypothetical protein
MALRTWTPKLICRDCRSLLACPFLWRGDGGWQCCKGGWTKLGKNRSGSPQRRPDCPIGSITIEDSSHRPRRQS